VLDRTVVLMEQRVSKYEDQVMALTSSLETSGMPYVSPTNKSLA